VRIEAYLLKTNICLLKMLKYNWCFVFNHTYFSKRKIFKIYHLKDYMNIFHFLYMGVGLISSYSSMRIDARILNLFHVKNVLNFHWLKLTEDTILLHLVKNHIIFTSHFHNNIFFISLSHITYFLLRFSLFSSYFFLYYKIYSENINWT